VLDGAAGSRPSLDASYVSPLCSGSSFRSADQVVAAAVSGKELVLLTASGATRTVATFDVPDGATTAPSISTSGGRVTASWSWTNPGLTAGGETIRLDEHFDVLYRLPATPTVASDAGIAVYPDRFIAADGTVTQYADAGQGVAVTFRGPPDADGWMLASWQRVNELGNHDGALNVDGRIRRFFDWSQSGTYSTGTLGGELVLLFGPPFTLAFETTAAATTQHVDLTTMDGSPSLLLYFWGRASVGLVTSAYDGRIVRVDARTHAVRAVTPTADVAPAIQASVTGGMQVSSDGSWFLGSTFTAEPVWRYDAKSDRLSKVTADAITQLRFMDGGACGRPTIGTDGEVGVGLRDDAAAGFYVGSNDSGFRRIGLPLRDVTAVTGERTGDTWVVTGNSGQSSYCTRYAPYSRDGSDASSAITGDSVQIVPPSRPPLVFTFSSEWSLGTTRLDPTGLCAFHGDAGPHAASTVYDLQSGARTQIAPMAAFEWLP
jgi:hypothetical protein